MALTVASSVGLVLIITNDLGPVGPSMLLAHRSRIVRLIIILIGRSFRGRLPIILGWEVLVGERLIPHIDYLGDGPPTLDVLRLLLLLALTVAVILLRLLYLPVYFQCLEDIPLRLVIQFHFQFLDLIILLFLLFAFDYMLHAQEFLIQLSLQFHLNSFFNFFAWIVCLLVLVDQRLLNVRHQLELPLGIGSITISRCTLNLLETHASPTLQISVLRLLHALRKALARLARRLAAIAINNATINRFLILNLATVVVLANLIPRFPIIIGVIHSEQFTHLLFLVFFILDLVKIDDVLYLVRQDVLDLRAVHELGVEDLAAADLV